MLPPRWRTDACTLAHDGLSGPSVIPGMDGSPIGMPSSAVAYPWLITKLVTPMSWYTIALPVIVASLFAASPSVPKETSQKSTTSLDVPAFLSSMVLTQSGSCP